MTWLSDALGLGEAGVAAIGMALLHAVGAAVALRALFVGRSPEGTVAWILSLVLVPYLALPLYAVVGPGRYSGYVKARRTRRARLTGVAREADGLRAEMARFAPAALRPDLAALERLAGLPFARANRAELLVGGDATFRSMFEGIGRARRYVLAQFYTVADDRLGRTFAAALMERARAGVAVRLLYDEVGSDTLSAALRAELHEAGVAVSAFNGRRRWWERHSRVNYRNHRKLVVVDGAEAWTGGHNVADAYVDRDPEMRPWRDTHVRLAGPTVLGCQRAFLEDWHWATDEVLRLDWAAAPAPDGDLAVLALSTGPADEMETCGLAFGHLIARARERVWVASPYFVPDAATVTALQLAALRGVDVRVLIPARPDHRLAWFGTLSTLPDLLEAGVEVRAYAAGVLHQKVALFDGDVATVGSANFDNRSFALNFELTLVVADPGFAAETARMLEADFERARKITAEWLACRPLPFRLAVRMCGLLAPIL